MKKFEITKTIQLIIYVALAGIALLTVFRDEQLYQMIGANPHVRLLSMLLWACLALAFLFMFFDFGSYTDLKRENVELDQAVYADALTGVANRYSCDAYIGRYLNQKLPGDMACITLDLLNLREINEKEGHSGGDEAIRDFSEILLQASRKVFAQEDFFIGRNGGNKFLAICRNSTRDQLNAYLLLVRKMTDARSNTQEGKDKIPIRYSEGHAEAGEEGTETLTALVALSDRRAMQET